MSSARTTGTGQYRPTFAAPSPIQEQQVAERRKKREENAAKRKQKLETLKNEGNALFKSGAYAKAAEVYGKAIEEFGRKPVLLSNLSAAFSKLELWVEAEWAATLALQGDPKMIKARFRRAVARKEMNRFRAAMADLQTIISEDPSCEAALAEHRVVEGLWDGNWDGDYGSSDDDEWPHYDEEGFEFDSDSDTSDCLHIGNGVACRFYNHGGCSRGDECRFSHGPDDKSVRDELGKNVCLYHLLGSCKYGDASCIYSHDKRFLPSPAWWEDPLQVEQACALLALAEYPFIGIQGYHNALRRNPHGRGVAGNIGREVVMSHLKQANALASKAQPKKAKTTAEKNSNRFVLLISLENEDYFESIYSHLLKALRAKYKVVQVESANEALEHLSSPDLVAVLATDAGIARKKHWKVLTKLIEYVRSGGSAVMGAMFSSHITGTDFSKFFSAWGVPWKWGSYHRTTFYLNPGNQVVQRNPSLAPSYSMKALHADGIAPEMAIYKPTSESFTQSLVWAPSQVTNLQEYPAVGTPIGQGYLGYIGDVNGEDSSTNTILAMLGILDTPHPGSGDKQEGSSRSVKNGQASTSGGDTSKKEATAPMLSQQKVVLILALEGPTPQELSGLYSDQLSALRKEAKVQIVKKANEVDAFLHSPDLLGVYIVDAEIAKPANADLLKRLAEYAKGGGIVVAGALFPSAARGPDIQKVFSAFGLKWRIGSCGLALYELQGTTELDKKNPSLPETFEVEALSLTNISSEEAGYIEMPDEDDMFDDYNPMNPRPDKPFESPVLRSRVGKGIVGYLGDMNAEDETTDILLALFGLLDLPAGPPQRTPRQFVMVLSLGDEEYTEQVHGTLLKSLSTKVEVIHRLSTERMADLMDSPDLIGVIVDTVSIASPKYAYILSKLVEFTKTGGTAVFTQTFARSITICECRPFFMDGWGLEWSVVAGHYGQSVKPNPTNALVATGKVLPKVPNLASSHAISTAVPEHAVYVPKKSSSHTWDPKENLYTAPVLFAPAEKGYVGFVGGWNETSDDRGIAMAMLGLQQ